VLELTRQSEAVIPSALVKLWQPVLYLLNKLHLTTHLLHSLACGLTEEGHLCDCLSVGWIARILAAIANSSMFIAFVNWLVTDFLWGFELLM